MDSKEQLLVNNLYRVESSYFVAGFETANGKVIRSAPILRRILPIDEQKAIEAIRQKGWRIRRL